MACCKVCCGCQDCTEGQPGKCCCGGSSGECCSESEYCCGGVCQAEPCGGACCLPDGTCVDGLTQEECEACETYVCYETLYADPCPEGWVGTNGVCNRVSDVATCEECDAIGGHCQPGESGPCGTYYAGKTCAEEPCCPCSCTATSMDIDDRDENGEGHRQLGEIVAFENVFKPTEEGYAAAEWAEGYPAAIGSCEYFWWYAYSSCFAIETYDTAFGPVSLMTSSTNWSYRLFVCEGDSFRDITVEATTNGPFEGSGSSDFGPSIGIGPCDAIRPLLDPPCDENPLP